MVDIWAIGADGTRLDLSGHKAGLQGILLAAGQVQGIYKAPIRTEYKRAARQRGGKLTSVSAPFRDLALGFHLFGDENPRGFEWLDGVLDRCFPEAPDEVDLEELSGRLVVRSKRDIRRLFVRQYDDQDFDPEMDPTDEDEQYGNPILKLRAEQPYWEGRKEVTHWQTDQTSDTGHIEVSNPTSVEMYQCWVLTLGKWTIPDPSWTGAKGRREPGGAHGARVVSLKNIDPVHAGARINYDPMRLMVESWSGTNLLGEIGGQDFFVHRIPPYTPKTLLPIKVENAPAGGARAELHQPRLWPKPWGGEWR